MARVRLIGIWKGTPPVTRRQKQSLLVLVMDFSELQQSLVGNVALALLLVRKLMQGEKLAIVLAVQGEPTCAETGRARTRATAIAITRRGNDTKISIVSESFGGTWKEICGLVGVGNAYKFMMNSELFELRLEVRRVREFIHEGKRREEEKVNFLSWFSELNYLNEHMWKK